MQFKLRTLLLLVGLTAIVIPVVLRFLPSDILAPVPESVLTQLDDRFEQLDSQMNFDEMFQTLGLARYRTYLEHRVLEHGGIGGMRSAYMFSNTNYELETVEYLDGRTACLLRTPKHPDWREAELVKGDSPLE